MLKVHLAHFNKKFVFKHPLNTNKVLFKSPFTNTLGLIYA